jgi:digeranylgeranylglycerophospholipid reductase
LIFSGEEAIEEADLVVVGAGPAGSTTAEAAALEGASVILLEGRKHVGVPVRCGEFMPSVQEMQGIFPNAQELGSLLGIPDKLVSMHIESINIFSPRLKCWELPFQGYTIDRDRFDQYLASKAVKAGARLITDCRFRGLREGEVITDKGSVRAKVLVGADGPISRVSSSMGMERPRELYPAVTAQTEGDFPPVCEMYFGGTAPGGYAWVIPKNGSANVGVGVCPRFARKSVIDYFKRFTEWRGLSTGKPTGKLVPMSGPLRNTVKANAMLVGDAAGQVMAVNGGGIPMAMICGRIAGRVAARHVHKGLSLYHYEQLCRREVDGPLRTAAKTKRWSMLFWSGQYRLEMAMRLLGERRMSNIIRCKPMLP